MEAIWRRVEFQRTENSPLMCVGYLGLVKKTMTWHYAPHWTHQPEELRERTTFRSRKEFTNFLRKIGYDVVRFYRMKGE